MKISNLNISRVKQTKAEVRPLQKASRVQPSGQDQVSISEEAKYLAGIRDAAGSQEDIRADMVEQARQDIAEGRLGTEEDYRRAVDALMMEL